MLSHEFVLKDSISLISQLECMNISQTQDVIQTSADVAVLYNLIYLLPCACVSVYSSGAGPRQ